MLYGIPAARGRSTLKNEMRRQELYWRRRVGGGDDTEKQPAG
jgi:hypothetical protein